VILQILVTTTAKRMKVDHGQRLSCSPLKVLSSDVYITLITLILLGVSPVSVYNQ